VREGDGERLQRYIGKEKERKKEKNEVKK